MDILLSPPIAFLLYLSLAAVLTGMGRVLAGASVSTILKGGAYASGEAPPSHISAPGYRPFFIIALFFAILHLGILMLGSSDLSPFAGLYLIGLLLALIALILG